MKLEWNSAYENGAVITETAESPDGHVRYVINHVHPGTFDYSRGIRYRYCVYSLDVYGEWRGNPAEARRYKRLGAAKRWAQKSSDDAIAFAERWATLKTTEH